MTDNDLEDAIESGVSNQVKTQTENVLETLGKWSFSLISSNDKVMEWRLKNLISTSEIFEKKCNKFDIPLEQRDNISKRFGITWIQGASEEDNNDIQDLWANILLKEAQHPNSVSRRTLEVIKNINIREKEVFDRISN